MNYKVLRETDENVVILPGAKVNGDVTFGPVVTPSPMMIVVIFDRISFHGIFC